ncbi:hypothetical protein AB4124_06045 [Paenibacillus sp. 2KB_20]|uniref:hypothetical protein n=1 Tax=Paenibacillus sp. 2KB_20 TaxID=3232977 RepID=UPI003F9C5889
MKFVAKPKLIVLDKKNGHPIARFDEKGVFETKDAGIAKKLKAAGYQGDGEVDEKEENKGSATPGKDPSASDDPNNQVNPDDPK